MYKKGKPMTKKSHENTIEKMKQFNEKPENTGGITCREKQILKSYNNK